MKMLHVIHTATALAVTWITTATMTSSVMADTLADWEALPYHCQSGSPGKTFRLANGILRLYPTDQIAASWDPDWTNNIHLIDCNFFPHGKDMTLNTIPEGAAIKCDANSKDVYRFTKGHRRLYPNPTIAASWDPKWNSPRLANCVDDGIKRDGDMAMAPAPTTPPATTPTPPYGLSTTEIQDMLNRINQLRKQNNVGPLTIDDRLMRSADRHSKDMATHCKMDHVGSDGSTFGDRIRAAGYNYAWAAENAAYGYATPETVMNSWINSPVHKANLLNPRAQNVGFARSINLSCGMWNQFWTQNFGTQQ